MNKKNILRLSSIILIVFGLLFIGFSFVSDSDKNDDKEINNNVDSVVKPDTPDDVPPITYDEVYNMAVSLYGGDNFIIELEEETDRFVIKRTYKDNGNIERYYVDKKNGSVYQDNVIIEG